MNIKYMSIVMILWSLFILSSPLVYADGEMDNEVVIHKVLGEEGMNIISSSENETITRAEMVDILTQFTQIGNDKIYSLFLYSNMDSSIIYFSDWMQDENKAPYISRLICSGIIEGCGEDRFEPDRECTYIEMLTFIVRSLGWKIVAENSYTYGTYPDGDIKVAYDLQIIEETKELEEIKIRKEMEKILFKSLFVETLKRDMYFHNTYSYVSQPCALEQYFQSKYVIGYAEKKEDNIVIEDVKYSGNVINDPEFERGNVLCIYQENEKTGTNEIKVCIALEEECYAYFSNLLETLSEVDMKSIMSRKS